MSSWNYLVSALLKKLPWLNMNMKVFSPSLCDRQVLALVSQWLLPGAGQVRCVLGFPRVCSPLSACAAPMFMAARGCCTRLWFARDLLLKALWGASLVNPPSLPHPQPAQSIRPWLLVKFRLFHLVDVIRSCAWKSNQIINFLSVPFISLLVLFLERKLSQIAALELHYHSPLKQDPDNSIVAGVWVTVLPWQKSMGL